MFMFLRISLVLRIIKPFAGEKTHTFYMKVCKNKIENKDDTTTKSRKGRRRLVMLFMKELM